MPSSRFLLQSCPLILALLFAGCGKKAPQAKAPPKPAPVVVAPEPVKPEGPPKPKTGAKTHPTFEGLAAARIEGGYVRLLYQNGRKGLFPVVDLAADEAEWLDTFVADHPLVAGKSTVVIAKTEIPAKKTIEKKEVVDGTETVQLCLPAKLRDQIGGTCMFYARVHYLDIAGYPVEDGEIYRVINNVPKDEPYHDMSYHVGMQMLFLKQKPSPLVHHPDNKFTRFEWARQELRKGRPILAALSENIWLALPADFLATHPWDGNNKIGHQVVINGFTYNAATKKATFHVVNSWRVLAEFDVPVVPRDEQNIFVEQSLSPKGEPPEVVVKVTAGAATLIKTVGKQNLYSVETNLGPQKVLAATEEAAKAFVEADLTDKDMDTAFGEAILQTYDFIQENVPPVVRDKAAAQMVTEAFKIPANVSLPHVDLVVHRRTGSVYLVRTAPEKVVKLYAESTGEALAKAQKM